MSKIRIGTPLVALVAMLAFASSAFAKNGVSGGGGGGGGTTTSCVRINDFSLTTGHDALGAPTLTGSYSIDNTCWDEGTAQAAEDSRNNTTGFAARSVWGLYPGLNTSTATSNAHAGDSITVTLTVYLPNGKVADQRTQTVTIPDAIAPAV
jgi:hypothetical protein